MPADIIYADFTSKTYHKLTLEEQAAHLVKEFNSMAEAGTEVVCEMIDGMPWLPDDGPLSGYKDPA